VAQLLDLLWLDAEKREALDEGTAMFTRHLISGTVENIGEVDALIKKHLRNWDFSRLNRVDLAILRMSVYSLIHQEDVPASIVIDEAVDISKEFGTDDSYRSSTACWTESGKAWAPRGAPADREDDDRRFPRCGPDRRCPHPVDRARGARGGGRGRFLFTAACPRIRRRRGLQRPPGADRRLPRRS
jgi:N utilization substance protein B